MSVLINMEMPTSCDDCRFAVDGWCYVCLPESDAERQRITTNYCPLVNIPPHGDLIDRDALIISLETQDYSCAPDTLDDWTPMDMTKAEIADIKAAPTIIPAEREDGAE